MIQCCIMQEQQKFYEQKKQEVDAQYNEHEKQHNELMAQINALENKLNKSELEQMELRILKAQEVQMSFQKVQNEKQRFEKFMGDEMLDDLKYRSNIIKSAFVALVVGIIAGIMTFIISEGVSRLIQGSLGVEFVLIVIVVMLVVWLIVEGFGRSEKWGNMTTKEIKEDIIDKHPAIFKDFQNQIDAEKKLERSTIYRILAQKLFSKNRF